MYRIRLHGRGGQGIKTAGRILGTAFFLEGFEVQDAPLYGAERRGAPISAYVRASRQVINERGIIRRPDLVLVADETLVKIPAAGILAGGTEHTVLLINSTTKPGAWQQRLNFSGLVLTFTTGAEPEAGLELRSSGALCVGAAARLVGVISRPSLAQAIREELASLEEAALAKTLDMTLGSFDLLANHAGCVTQGRESRADTYEKPHWIDFPFEEARVSAPVIHAPATSATLQTGLWRSVRPSIDYDHCHRCAWICSTLCPDSTITLNEAGYPVIDYDHCKGCLICLASCPAHAIRAVAEQETSIAADPGGGA
jgi:pyruvate ferredoxin oxidoreductase gamma subunit